MSGVCLALELHRTRVYYVNRKCLHARLFVCTSVIKITQNVVDERP